MSPRFIKPLSLFLGTEMFLFGFLKFFQPISGWFDVQIQQSHLPHSAILVGKLAELATGCFFLLPWLLKPLGDRTKDCLLLAACFLLFTQMGVAIYVHLQPSVPASVLPLGIKPPIIPVMTLVLGMLTAWGVWKEMQAGNQSTR